VEAENHAEGVSLDCFSGTEEVDFDCVDELVDLIEREGWHFVFLVGLPTFSWVVSSWNNPAVVVPDCLIFLIRFFVGCGLIFDPF
jgi:hypothetical protein